MKLSKITGKKLSFLKETIVDLNPMENSELIKVKGGWSFGPPAVCTSSLHPTCTKGEACLEPANL